MQLMAQRIVTELTDDTDGKPADETVTFALDGREYEIDLTAKNAAALRKAFDVYVKNGRRIGGRRHERSSPAHIADPPSAGPVLARVPDAGRSSDERARATRLNHRYAPASARTSRGRARFAAARLLLVASSVKAWRRV